MTSEVAFVKSALENLLQNHSSITDFSCLDEVVFSYVCGVVEDIATGDEDLNAIEMKDVMSAYIPAFEKIPEEEVESWVKLMIQKTLDEKDKDKTNKDVSLDTLVSCFSVPLRKHKDSTSTSASETSERSQKLSETSSECSEENCSKLKDEDQYCESLSILLELFPNTCSLEAQHCLSSSGGHLEEATSILLERQEQGISLKTTPGAKIATKSNKKVDDVTLRKSILNRYGFIDDDDDSKEHRPLAPKWEGKKMVRYLDNKVVSMKGERYTEIKKGESEEMKKTYVNLKPGKQYRFH